MVATTTKRADHGTHYRHGRGVVVPVDTHLPADDASGVVVVADPNRVATANPRTKKVHYYNDDSPVVEALLNDDDDDDTAGVRPNQHCQRNCVLRPEPVIVPMIPIDYRNHYYYNVVAAFHHHRRCR